MRDIKIKERLASKGHNNEGRIYEAGPPSKGIELLMLKEPCYMK